MTKEKVRKRRRLKRKMVIHRYRYYECAKFFEPSYLVELSLHVFSKHTTKLHIEILRKIYRENRDERIFYKCFENNYFKNARRFIELTNEIDKINDLKKLKELFNFDD